MNPLYFADIVVVRLRAVILLSGQRMPSEPNVGSVGHQIIPLVLQDMEQA